MKIEELKQYGHEYPFLPVYAYQKLKTFDPFLLLDQLGESAEETMIFKRDQVTTLVLSVSQKIVGRDGQIKITNASGQIESHSGDPLIFLNKLYQQYQIPQLTNQVPLLAGLLGYFSYDFVRYHPDVDLEPAQDDLDLADFDLLLPKVLVNYRHDSHELFLSQLVAAENLDRDFPVVKGQLEELTQKIVTLMAQADQDRNDSLSFGQKTGPTADQSNQQPLTFVNQFTRAEFRDRVHQAQKHIHAGDIFQLILSNPYQAHTQETGRLKRAFQKLSQGSPAPYEFYFRDQDYQAIGASPETLIRKAGEHLFSYPLAGTRRRGKTAAEDQFFAQELQNSAKELAEHNMLVDLGRNDLGRVSQFGTVAVTKVRNLLYFPNVMHLGSTIESRAQPNLSPIDILSATLPAGTLSGAPKISAMKIINQLENRKRGLYGGGIGTISFAGDLDICIGIRLAYQKKDTIVVQAGAGIVADSDPDQEYHEFENKSRLMIDLLGEEAATDAALN